MAKTALQTLLWENPKSNANSYEQYFYDENASLFNVASSKYNENRSLFDIIKSVAVLRGLLNRKILIDSYNQFPLDHLKRKEVYLGLQQQLPYFDFNGNKIFIPTYSVELNNIFANQPEKLYSEYLKYINDVNYRVSDPFSTYGISLLSSSFTRLTPLDTHSDTIFAFYHVDFETLFLTSPSLELLEEIPIFDEKVKNRNNIELFDNLNLVVSDYIFNDIEKMFKDMKDKNLISNSTYNDCMKNELKYRKRHI